MNYVCNTCGKVGSEDDGISGRGDECPDEECEGTIQWTEEGYREILEAAHEILIEHLDLCVPTHNDTHSVDLTNDQLHVLLDAVAELDLEIDSKNRRKPWEEYR